MSKRPSPAVYRRRRIVALLIVLLPILLLLRACSGSDEEPTSMSTETGTVTATETSTAAKAAKPKATAAATPATTAETTTATPSPSASPKLTDCLTTNIRVSVTADAQTYAVGQPVTIAMRISNIGAVPCKRDVGALVNEVYVTNIDGLVIWTSDACQKQAKPQVAIMKPNSVFGNTQIWSGLNSGQNCTTAAADAMPGKYLVYARNDVVVSKPFAIDITDEPIATP